MRISSKLERKSQNLNPKPKYYIVPEGKKTEIDYFIGIRENAENIGISSLIDIIPIVDNEEDDGHSHPIRKIEHFKKDLDDGVFLYDSQIDKVCIVVDRDRQSFSDVQYQEAIQKCEKYGFDLYVSNPTFEIFLLMHSNELGSIDRDELLANRRISRHRRFLESKLSEIFGCSKVNLDFKKFLPNIDLAIEQEAKYVEDIESLKDELGSNVGLLIKKMKNK